ncbi:DUF4430 domain-containing protein [Oceanobacillus bengalensis]|uniref:DUF4430 domain-containing protein n=1 Tax=Oceanobacillus bengalensis TaxID=1435466 RepID=A0A494YXP2_9BACI|nr:DUF4430 domain-containing protein [Oceanobacillus bengalensis]RKQ15005.1 DUF4430 domain-containing protein [Oceanobacillus bengalensis]
MPVWMKRLLFICSILFIFIVSACGSSLEKPLSKEDSDKVEESSSDESYLIEDTETADTNQLNEVEEEPEKQADKTEEEKRTEEKISGDNNGQVDKQLVSSESTKNVSKESKQKEDSTGDSKSTNVTKETQSKKEKKNKPEEAEESIRKDSSNSSGKENTPKETTNSSRENEENKPNDTTINPGDKKETPEDTKDTIVYSIVISTETNEIPLPPTEIEIEEGDTVLDALIEITREKKIQMDYRGGQGATAYIEGIANVYEFDRGQGSGWMYRVNGIFPDRGAGVVPLLAGDRVEWLYTTDLGADLGADLQPFRR